MSGTYTTWTISVKNKALKDVMPVSLEVVPETENYTVLKWGFWPVTYGRETGKFVLVLEYRENPFAKLKIEEWTFDTHDEAVEWYNFLYKGVFLAKPDVTAPVAPKSPKKKSHLSLVKD